MQKLLLIVLFVSVQATSAQAETTAPFWGASEKLILIAKTPFAGQAHNQALCAQVTDQHMFTVPIKRTVGGYVFSKTDCVGGKIYPLAEDSVVMYKNAGIIPQYVPDRPQVPLTWTWSELGIATLLGLLVFLAPMVPQLRASCCPFQGRRVSGDPVFFDVLLTVMFHTARTDGAIENSELNVILKCYKELTGSAIKPEAIASRFSQSMSDDTIVNLVKPYSGAEAELLLDAAVFVATKNGALTREKRTLLTAISAALGRDQSGLKDMLNAGSSTAKMPEPA